MADDVNDLLGRLLNDPATMETLQGVLSSLKTEETPPTPTLDLSALQGLLSGGTNHSEGASPLASLLPLLSKGGDNAADVTLLRALRPYLHEGREKRIDEAIDILRLVKLLPLLTKKP